MVDRVGLAWRPELAAGLYQRLGAVDLLEFLADAWLADRPRPVAELTAWAGIVPVHLHGTRLGLASAEPLDDRLLRRWRALLAAVRPAAWSEHLALVGAGGLRLPHFAAPPRTPGGAAVIRANLAQITARVGRPPLVENPATLMEPCGSTWDEATWLTALGDAPRLLDLHNLFANAHLVAGDPLATALAMLDRLPLAQVVAVHVAGGRAWRGRWLDDHRHAVPAAVWTLLEELARRVPGPLDVILERDGDFPPLDDLLAEVATARTCLARGRQRPLPVPRPAIPAVSADPGTGALQARLVALLADPDRRATFLADPQAPVDRAGLEAAVASLAAKRHS